MSEDGFREVKIRLVLEEGSSLPNGDPIRTPEDAVNYLAQEMKQLPNEHCVVVNLDSSCKPINFQLLSAGGIKKCPVPMDTIFQSAILSNSAHIMLLHNHPSGSLTASQDDIEVTRKLKQASDLMGIPLLDHIIVAGESGDYLSMLEERPDLFQADLRPEMTVADSGRTKIQETMEKLQEGVKAVFDSEKYKEHLKVMSRFHHYSVNNQLLIGMQMPDASLVAGYQAWERNFGRHVKKGSKAITIISPVIKKEKRKVEMTDENQRVTIREEEYFTTRFRATPVFDISQTYGPELPTIAPKALVGKVVMYDDLQGILKEISPVPIRFDDFAGEAKGYYSYIDKEIVVREGMSEAQTVKTEIHEISHARLHDRDEMEQMGEKKDLQTKEVEAESVAFVTCASLGLPTDDYSFPYIAGWSDGKDLKVLQNSLATIRSTADGMITEIEEKLNAIDRYEIYQIGENSRLADHRFCGSEEMAGMEIKATDYERVYMGRYYGESLEDIFEKFNMDHPKDFTGHSLSVSDVVVLHQDGIEQAYFVDQFGFTDIPDFKNFERKEQKYEKKIEKTVSDVHAKTR